MDHKDAYHYVQCGLPNVWILNGFKKEKNQYGEFISIEDIDGLHRAIACALTSKPTPLSGMEFRFIRRELDMSQKRLGEILGRDRQSIANWEKKGEVAEPYDFLIRHVYQQHLDRNARYVELVDRLNELDRLEYDGLRFATCNNGWHKAA